MVDVLCERKTIKYQLSFKPYVKKESAQNPSHTPDLIKGKIR